MASLISKSLCASILTAIIVVSSQTADIFDLTKAALGLDERQFLDSSFTGNIAELTNMIPKRESDIIEYFQRNDWKVYSFLSQLYQNAMDVADKKMDRKVAFAAVNMYYNELSTSQQNELDRLSKDIKQLLRGKASTGGSSYATAKSELQHMVKLLNGLSVQNKKFTETVSRTEGLLKGEPVSWTAQEFKEILDSFMRDVKDFATKGAITAEFVKDVTNAYNSFCSAVAAVDPLKKNICNITVTYAESFVAETSITDKEKLKKLEKEMRKVEKQLKM